MNAKKNKKTNKLTLFLVVAPVSFPEANQGSESVSPKNEGKRINSPSLLLHWMPMNNVIDYINRAHCHSNNSTNIVSYVPTTLATSSTLHSNNLSAFIMEGQSLLSVKQSSSVPSLNASYFSPRGIHPEALLLGYEHSVHLQELNSHQSTGRGGILLQRNLFSYSYLPDNKRGIHTW